jgi:hypothetical protein
VILDGTLLRIDRVGMASGYDRAFYSGKHKAHGLNVRVIADPIAEGLDALLGEHRSAAGDQDDEDGGGCLMAR